MKVFNSSKSALTANLRRAVLWKHGHSFPLLVVRFRGAPHRNLHFEPWFQIPSRAKGFANATFEPKLKPGSALEK